MTQVPSDLPIILLAAGQSSRMRGADKLLEMVEGVPLVRRQAEMACAATSGPVIVALPDAPHPRYSALEGLQVQIVPVPDASEGMNASLRRAFATVPADAPAAMLLLCDLPDLTTSDLKTVLQAVDLNKPTLVWRGTTDTGAPGHPIVFAAPLFDRFAKLTGDAGGRDVIKAAQGHIEMVPLPGNRARMDLDTPEAWAEWRARQTD